MSGEGLGPARGYTWPPFTVDNEAGLRHGARSPRHLGPVVDQLRVELAGCAPWTQAQPFAPVVESWVWVEAQCVLYRRWFDRLGLFGENGEPLPGLGRWEAAERRAASLRAELGLTPHSLVGILARLASTAPEALASSLDQLRAAGAAIRASAEHRELPPAGEAEQGGDGRG